ncbi:MAG: GNAT family N-acetyltransferase [Catenulisporales bacterium]|nr:GNAT family N-acetyltransferase [Catenulisporales bacterium]
MARPEDLNRIAELENRVFDGTGFSSSVLLQLYGPSGVAWLVAEDSAGIWGYSLCMRATDDPRVGWILALGVHPERRGEHIGRTLLDESIVELRSRDMETIMLTVKPDNMVAYGLYLRAGFQDTGEWKKDIGDGSPRKILTLLLTPTPTPSEPEETADEQHKEKVPEDVAGVALDFQDWLPGPGDQLDVTEAHRIDEVLDGDVEGIGLAGAAGAGQRQQPCGESGDQEEDPQQ